MKEGTLKKLGSLLNNLTQRGIEQYDESIATKVVLTNYLCLVAAGACFPYGFVYYWAGYKLLGVLLEGICLSFFLFIFLNTKGHIQVSRLGLITFLNLIVFIYADFMGRHAGVQMSLFFCALSTGIIFSRKEQWQIAYSVLTSLSVFLALELSNYSFFHDQYVHVQIQKTLYLVLMPTLYLLIFYIVLVGYDISVTETNRRFSQMARSIDEVFWITSPDGREVLYISPAFEKIWGITVKELYQKKQGKWIHTVHPEDRQMVQDLWTSLVTGQFKTTEIVFRCFTASGSMRWILDRWFPIYDSDGNIDGFCGVTTDITHKKESEKVVEEQRAKMIASAKLAELGEMAGGIAHEINNPLAIVQASATQLGDLADRGKLDINSLKKIADRIESTCIRIAKIVSGLRTFAHGGESDPFEPVEISLIIKETLGLCQERFRNSSVALQVNNKAEGLKVECRQIQVSQALLNLLSNAFDAVQGLPERWVRVDVHVEANQLVLAVTDSGQGIPAEIREKILQPFFTTKQVGKGTGLGLSIARGIAESHHGSLYLDERSQNTRFVIMLPLVQSAQDRIATAA